MSSAMKSLSSMRSFPQWRSSSLRSTSLYADATDEAYFFADEQHEALLHRISDGWKNTKNFDRAPALTRYQKILALAGQPVFGEDDRAFENVRDLVEIRNYLVHFRREWVTVSRDRARETAGESATEKFEKVLRKKFAANPLAAKNAPFFPDKCLGHGCAEWAIVNSLIFVDEFFRRLGLPVPTRGCGTSWRRDKFFGEPSISIK